MGEYDAIVIGTGLGGLTAGALLARAGWSVLPVANLAFWTYLDIWRMPLALIVLGPILVLPSLYALRVIWRRA